MEITALGHAGLRITGTATTGLIDPWLSTSGAFLGSWHQLPANDHLATDALLRPDWVAISHDHQDHLDLATLAKIPAGTPVYVPEYPSRRLVRLLATHTRLRVFEVEPWTPVELDDRGSWLTFVREHSPMCHDAAVLVRVDGVSVLDCNDARLTAAQTLRASQLVGQTLDVMMVQTSGASWHPICYEYPEPVMRSISAQKRRAKLQAVHSLVRATSPRVAIPFAGPPCFLDPALADLDRWLQPPGIFPTQDQTAAWLRERLPGQRIVTLLPGDIFVPLDLLTLEDPHWQNFSFDHLRDYLRDYAHARAVDLSRSYTTFRPPDDTLGERFAEHFARLGELSPYFLQQIDMTVRFEVEGDNGGRWDVELGPRRVRVDLTGQAAAVQYRFRLASRWLAAVVDGRIGWEDLLLSFRFSAARDPDVYNDYLVGLLKHADRASLRAVEEYDANRDADATIVVQSDHGGYELNRYCPHAGEDLGENGVVDGRVIRCLGHNYEFDLETGACVNGRCAPLSTRALAPSTSAGI
jgi:nitrite reductase/ring-hydroxylating ferredoxin subunit